MPWLDGTAAVLQMYYPGQEGAAATAAVLFGDCDPGGGSPSPSRSTTPTTRSPVTRTAIPA